MSMNPENYAGYRLIKFPESSKEYLQEVGNILLKSRDDILNEWTERQCCIWTPPGFSEELIREIFGELLDTILTSIAGRQLELCIDKLEESGTKLAIKQFPFEALIFSVHFLEQSYLHLLIGSSSDRTREWLVAMDEFLHAALAAIATSYFNYQKRELLEQVEIGQIVQEGLLADIPKTTADIEIAHVYISSREKARIGGDFLDFFTLPDGGAAFIIGDLSGHGFEAASDSLMLRYLFRGFMRENPQINDTMERINRILDTELKACRFATALAATYSLNGEIRMVNAGHPYPILYNEYVTQIEFSNLALAILPETEYLVYSTTIEPGGVFVAFTDGLNEAKSDGDMFGEQKIMDVVSANKSLSARSIAERLIDTASRHAGGQFEDDVAILVIKRLSND